MHDYSRSALSLIQNGLTGNIDDYEYVLLRTDAVQLAAIESNSDGVHNRGDAYARASGT
jgi:hypothetical protein